MNLLLALPEVMCPWVAERLVTMTGCQKTWERLGGYLVHCVSGSFIQPFGLDYISGVTRLLAGKAFFVVRAV